MTGRPGEQAPPESIDPVAHLLLLLPSSSYRAEAFLEAAAKLGAEVTVGSDHRSTLTDQNPTGLLHLDFHSPARATLQVLEFHRQHRIDAVVGVDDRTAALASVLAEALELPHNPIAATAAAGNKRLSRERLHSAGVAIPRFRCWPIDADPEGMAAVTDFPCVIKPLCLSASRGVMRADNPLELSAAVRRLRRILASADLDDSHPDNRSLLIEAYIPGDEVALEGLLRDGRLEVLALFDKPDPLEGPFFEETLYITPSRLPGEVQASIIACAAAAARALGLREGPVHAELRINEHGPFVIETAARSIGGKCSRVLRFGAGMALEELILRHALGQDRGQPDTSSLRERSAAGVMMLPIPRAGVLRRVGGKEAALAVPCIDELTITAHLGQLLVPLPEGSQYLGFMFARAPTPAAVEAALREAHARLEIDVEDVREEAGSPAEP